MQKYASVFWDIYEEFWKIIIGQDKLIRDLLITLLCKWHVLLEWSPWLAKTLSVSTLSKIIDLDFKRIQFTPDLLPSDLVWNVIYNPETKEFFTKKWPIFTNLVLADEINRAPSKVQSALLEAMAEKQVTIWDNTYSLEDEFMVLATQNQIEQDWTYSLPEAQLDRFLLKTIIDYPSEEQEIEIMKKYSIEKEKDIKKIIKKSDIKKIISDVEEVFVDENIYNYVKDLIFYSRNDSKIKEYLLYWASPRASIALIKTSKALAFLSWRNFVLPEDVKEMIKPVLRHRLILSYEALAEWITSDNVIDIILNNVKIK